MNFIEKSKELHKSYSARFWSGAFDPTLHPDTRRHFQLLASTSTFLESLSCNSALTVGDNLCRDGFFLKQHIRGHVTSSDLCMGEDMHKAVDKGYVDNVISADIENLPFADESFDLIFAKEAFHHWPRPMLGFYEMLRVAKKCIILIEPIDIINAESPCMLSGGRFRDSYEVAGNYKYQLSIREIIKAAWSLRMPYVAYKGFNDPYKKPFDFDQWLVEKQRLDSLGTSGIRPFNLCAVALYKNSVDVDVSILDSDSNISLATRPLNPHLDFDSL